jgi:hypothetical protein
MTQFCVAYQYGNSWDFRTVLWDTNEPQKSADQFIASIFQKTPINIAGPQLLV